MIKIVKIAENNSFQCTLYFNDICCLFYLKTGLMRIELVKPPSGELGFGLVTAEKDQQTGIFVRSITEDGVADRDGRLQVMDRIVQVRMFRLLKICINMNM